MAEPANKRDRATSYSCSDYGEQAMLKAVSREYPLAASGLTEAPPLLVLKFGGSILHGLDDLPRVAGEIYRQRRRGFDVVAVVSALHGETDRFLAEAKAVGSGRSYAGTADLVSLGEARTVALLRLACDRIGLAAAGCQAEELGLRTSGPETGSRPVSLDPLSLRTKLARTGLVIVPGFVGIGADGGRALLARGGSDFSAIFLAGELGAAVVRLYKDVDGVFEADPNCDPTARRYDEISWAEALQVARPLIQPQAVKYAASKRLPIEVEAIGSARVTRVAERTGTLRAGAPEKPIRVALAGYGVVGRAVAQRLQSEPRFEIVSVLVREPHKSRKHACLLPLTPERDDFLQSEPDVLIDVLSCASTSHVLCDEMLGRGVHVVTASKRMISERLESGALSPDAGTALAYSGSVGGSAPMLELISRTSGITSVLGVLNGTVNFVLTLMARGSSLVDALSAAQMAGFAEADASADLSGADAAAKLHIIAHHAFPGVACSIHCEALDTAAALLIEDSSERWSQLSSLKVVDGVLRGSIALIPASATPSFEMPAEEWNCLTLKRGEAATVTCVGRGAGGAPTAEAVIADLYDIADANQPIRASIGSPQNSYALRSGAAC